MKRRSLLQLFSVLALSAGAFAAQAQDKPIKIGATGGPHAEILEVVKKIAAKDGLNIQIVEFSDYVQPNAARAAGDLGPLSRLDERADQSGLHDRRHARGPHVRRRPADRERLTKGARSSPPP